MKLILTRKWFTTRSTIGELHIPETGFRCYTLEDVARAAGVKIYGQTAIPEGTYSWGITQSARFGKILPLIWNAPNNLVVDTHQASWSGIRIHAGNTHEDTDGCILVGEQRGEDAVYASRMAMERLMRDLDKHTNTQSTNELLIFNRQQK